MTRKEVVNAMLDNPGKEYTNRNYSDGGKLRFTYDGRFEFYDTEHGWVPVLVALRWHAAYQEYKDPMPIKKGELCLVKNFSDSYWKVDRFKSILKETVWPFACVNFGWTMIAEYQPEIAFIEGAMPEKYWTREDIEG